MDTYTSEFYAVSHEALELPWVVRDPSGHVIAAFLAGEDALAFCGTRNDDGAARL